MTPYHKKFLVMMQNVALIWNIISCQKGLGLVSTWDQPGWDILNVFPIRADDWEAENDPLSQEIKFVVRVVQ